MPVWLLTGGLGWLRKGFDWLKGLSPSTLAIIALVALCALQTARLGHVTKSRNQLRITLEAERDGYRKAARAAEAAQQANLARVAKEQSAITERVSHDYQARIDAARAAADRLRIARDQVSDRTGRVSAPSQGTPGTSEAPQDGFSLADRLTAQEQAIQLDELITWVEAQSNVDTGGHQ